MKNFTRFLLTMMAVLVCTLNVWAAYNGTPETPVQITEDNYTDYGFTADNWQAFENYYGIRTAEELYGFAALVNGGETAANGVLTANIVVNENVLNDEGDLNGTPTYSWTPIGTTDYNYKGTFDGNGHTISGLYCNTPSTNYIGLFGYASNGGIKNLGVIDSYFSGKQYVGGISGQAYGCAITNCYNKATIVGSDYYIGGICGRYGAITDCYNQGTVYGSSSTGGINGSQATVTNCYNIGKVSGKSGIGGICGADGRVTKCYNAGSVTALGTTSGTAGGIVGSQSYNILKSCYNTGTVTGLSQVGGICGYLYSGMSINGCYNTGIVEGTSKFQSICGVINGDNGNITNCVYLAGSVADRESVGLTSAEFANGKATYLLNGSTSSGDWYQTIGEDNMPVLDNTHGKVYGTSPCASAFSNDGSNTVKEHDYHSGICSQCGEYEPATLADGVYQIANMGQLYWFANLVNGGTATAKGELTADIVVNENVLTNNGELNGTPSRIWTPIGTETNMFKGTFNGNNHTVSGLYADYGSYIGLFGYASNATISNVGVVDSYFSSGGSYIGGICGYAISTTINLCYNEGVVGGYTDIGGICGYLDATTISNCYNMGAVTSNDATTNFTANVGGIYGYITGNISYVSNCYNAGTVRGGHLNYCVGSIGGNIGSNTVMTNCYYLVGSAVNWGGVVQNGIGSSSHTETTADVAGKTEPFNSIFDVRSGRLTYLLNGSVDGGTTCYQTIGTDDRPTWDDSHGLVYESSPCPFSNNSDGVAEHHYDEFGQCTVCGVFKQPTLITEENHDDYALGEEYIGYYAIGDAIELLSFAAMVNEGNTDIKGVLVADIVANENVLNNDGTLNGTPNREWTPIGTEEHAFAGVFDGNNHTVSGLYFSNDVAASYPMGGSYIGLVGYASGALITNVGILDSYFYGNRNIGGICGGAFEQTEINNCYNKGTLSGNATIGGICGYAQTSNITICYNNGTIDVGYSAIGGSAYIGGIVGATSNNATVSDCYNAGAITSRRDWTYVGGIAGLGVAVQSCYNIGSISGIYSVGAICGTKGGSQSNCYYLEGSAIDEEKGVQNGIGSESDATIADKWGECTMATAQDFANGEVTYHLNNGKSEGDIVWYQTIGSDDFPVWDNSHNVVYASSPCHTEYSNEAGAAKPHSWDEFGQCTVCKVYQEAPLVTEENYAELNLTEEHIGFYAIGNAGQLYWFAELVNDGTTDANGVLVADVVVNKNVLAAEGKLNGDGSNFKKWIPIGYYENLAYHGIFDGNGHTVSGIYFSDTYGVFYGHGMRVGLFGMASESTIKNLGIIDSYYRGYTYIGAICGLLEQGTITNCYSVATLSACDDGNSVGGICGHTSNALIENCSNTGLIGEGNNNMELGYGGICGTAANNSTIINCHNMGNVSSSSSAGGICGAIQESKIEKCYNKAVITSRGTPKYSVATAFGGICGDANKESTIENCYNTGNINVSARYAGGICGETYNASILNCYNTGIVTTTSYAGGGICGGVYYGELTLSNNYYLEGCATACSDVAQYGLGISTWEESLADVEGQTIPATAEEFASGKIGLLLNGEENNAWYQTLFSDASPVLDSTHSKITGYVEGTDVITVHGDLLIGADYEIAENKIFNIPVDATVTTTGNAVITNNGTIIANGTIAGNDLAGEGNFTYNQFAESDITLNTDSYTYKASAFTLVDGLDVTINREFCGKTFTFDDSYTTVSYENNRNVTTEGKVIWTNSVTSKVIERDFTITSALLTVTDLAAFNKVYDGNTVAEGSYTSDKFENDDITIDYTATFSDKNVGENKTVTFNFTKSGADANNYEFANATGTAVANITPALLTVTDLTALNKIYDGNTVAEGSYSTAGILENDDVTVDYTATFSDKNVGENKEVTFNFTKSGNDADNYEFANATDVATANITPALLTLTDFTVLNKEYDGTTNATGGSFTDNRIAGDELEFTFDYEFADENAGEGIAVNFSNIAISGGNDAANYELATSEGTATADITKIEGVQVTLKGSRDTVMYDGAAHTVEGFAFSVSNALYKESDMMNNGPAATVSQTEVGETKMGLVATNFSNISKNFSNVTFEVEDGGIVVEPKNDVVVTITENSGVVTYNGAEKTVNGYTVAINTELYKETDFTFNGTAEAKGTAVGEYGMNISAEEFENTNANFVDVTFNVVDGKLTIEKSAETPNMPELAIETHMLKLSLIELPEGWAWEDATMGLVVGDNEAVANYVGNDAGNYTTESVTITITRHECTHEGEPVVLGAKEATCTVDGYTGDLSCPICGMVYQQGEVIPAKGHTAGEFVIENYVAPTCTAVGTVDTVYYCTIDHEEISRETSELPMLEHVAGEKVAENYVAPTFTAVGSVDSVVYCTIGGEELSRETYVLPIEATAISDVTADATAIYAFGHTIVVETTAFIGSDIMVYDINGRTIAKVQATDERTEINAARTGVYGVRIENVSSTVMIR